MSFFSKYWGGAPAEQGPAEPVSFDRALEMCDSEIIEALDRLKAGIAIGGMTPADENLLGQLVDSINSTLQQKNIEIEGDTAEYVRSYLFSS